ncbi:TetR/AcrR family transcriptional regulator [Streptomyces sp. NPDC006134]|uniref:TetR/AcrR family transcriptional regulator n=1 Tax=Streptomyces sp. NPDC006134 TaxID=3154467 RepID=UPI0033D0F6C3
MPNAPHPHEDSEGSLDPRVRRTRARLRTALLDLSAERDLDTITMADIAKRAEVNRATVYLHYKDRDDLLLDATDSAMSALVEAVRACRTAPAADDRRAPDADTPPGHLVTLFTHVARHRPLYARMLGEDGSSRFTARLERRLAEAWREQLALDTGADGIDSAVRAHYVSGGLVALITHWAEGTFDATGAPDTPLSPDHLARLAWPLIRPRP